MLNASSDFGPSGCVVLRTPLLPFHRVYADAASCTDGTVNSIAVDCARAKVVALLADPAVNEALYLASPTLHAALAAAGSRSDKKADGLLRAACKYLMRMSSRPTPFGLVAGVSVGRVGDKTSMRLVSRHGYVRRTRLDMEYAVGLGRELLTRPDVRRAVYFGVNETSVVSAGKLHYAERKVVGRGRQYTLAVAECDEWLARVLDWASHAIRLDDLEQRLADAGVPVEDARAFLDELVEAQILVPEFGPLLTGADALDGMLPTLDAIPSCGAASTLRQAQVQLSTIDKRGIGVSPDQYRALGSLLTQEIPGVPVDQQRLVQVDLFKPAVDLTLGPQAVEAIVAGVEVLRRTSPRQDPLHPFRAWFRERYDRREVPLLEALDPEIGIGLPKRDLAGRPADETIFLRESVLRDRWLTEQTVAAIREGRDLALSAETIPQGRWRWSELPDAFTAVAMITSPDVASSATGDMSVYLRGVSTASGVGMLGRFCYGDAELARCVADHLRTEEALAPDAVFAEIVHLPSDRMGNIVFRPILRQYEIAYLGRSGAADEFTIPLSDLKLRLTDAGDRLVLRSTRLNKEVIPRLTTAHNFEAEGNPLLYQFLCLLQCQSTLSGLAWHWGSLASLPYLPRVVAGRTVLSLARWTLPDTLINELRKLSLAERVNRLGTHRTAVGIPQYVLAGTGDQALVIDLEDPLQVDVMLSLGDDAPGVTVAEMFPPPAALPVTSDEGRFVGEVCVPFVRRVTHEGALNPRVQRPEVIAQRPRTFGLGSEWLYAKLYCGRNRADQVIGEYIRPFVHELTTSSRIDRWFFIRYSDPFDHLRVRLHGDPAVLQDKVLPEVIALARQLEQRGLIWKTQFDTYDAEVERYGGPRAMEVVEEIFHHDSEASALAIATFPGEEGLASRTHLALCMLDGYFRVFGVPLHKGVMVLRLFSRTDPETARQWAAQYRAERSVLNRIFRGEPAADERFDACRAEIERSLGRMDAATKVLLRLKEERALTVSLKDLLASLTHMHCNRMLRAGNSREEQRLYDILRRHYQAAEAIRDTASGYVTAAE